MAVESKTDWVNEPTEQGLWWHVYDNPEMDAEPFIYSILQSNSGPKPRFFVAAPDSRWVSNVGGLWMKVQIPSLPNAVPSPDFNMADDGEVDQIIAAALAQIAKIVEAKRG